MAIQAHPENRGDRNPARSSRLQREAAKNLQNSKPSSNQSKSKKTVKEERQQASTVTDGEDG